MYDYITLTQTNIDGSISPFPNGASGLILLGTGTSTPPQWISLADAGIATKSYVDNTFLPLAGGTLTGALAGTSASFSGAVSATGGFTGDLTGTASNASKVANALSIQLGSNTAQSYDGSAAVSVQVTPAAIGAKTDFSWPQAGIMTSGGTNQAPSNIAWPTGSGYTDGFYLLVHHKQSPSFTDSWYKIAGESSGAGVLAWSGTGTGTHFDLLQGANSGDVLTFNGTSYAFAPIASAIVPAITGLQSGTNSTTSKILLGGADASSSPTWVSLTDVPTGLSAGVAKIDSNGKLTSGAIALNGSEVTNTLPVSKGGTGLSQLGTANQVLTSNGSTMAWADKVNAAVTADQVAHHLGFTVKNGNTVSTLYYDGSAAVDGGNLLPIQKIHAAGILKGNGTAWTSSIEPITIAGVTKQVLVAIDQSDTWGYDFEPLSSVLPAITGLASGSTNEGYILSVGASPGYTPTWIPRTDLNIPSAPSSLPLVDNETGALGTAGTYANADHQHPLPYAVQAAYKFFYPRKIGIGGAITAEAQEYDGTADLILQVTEIDPYAIINAVPIEKGGTGATTASAALTNLGAAAANHNHDSTYLKLSGGTMTGGITFADSVQVPFYWLGTGHAGVAVFGAGEMRLSNDVSNFVKGNTEFKSYYDDSFSQGSGGGYLERVTLAHTNGKNTVYNLAVGDQEPSGASIFTRNIKLPAPSADNLGDELTIIFTNKNTSAIGTINCDCETSSRLVKYDYSIASSLSWGSGNIVKFVCFQVEENGTTYYWRAIKQVEQSW